MTEQARETPEPLTPGGDPTEPYDDGQLRTLRHYVSLNDPESQWTYVVVSRLLATIAALRAATPDPAEPGAVQAARDAIYAYTGADYPLLGLISDLEVALLRAASTVEPGLRALFARYIEHHGEPAEWDTDDGWCQKHLPRIEEVRAALTPDETA